MEKKAGPLLLEGLRVLDLAEEGALMAGRILGDLGADVIKIEEPGGSRRSRIGPFYKDIVHLEKSLYWFAYNANKRGITLDIRRRDGQEILRQLVAKADFVIESFPPGYLGELGLGYEALAAINRRVILTSITPFGQSGPYSRYKGSELTCMAMSGFLYLNGDSDRPPVWISLPQAYLNAGAEAAAGALVAHWCREETGEGDHVDVSVQECAAWLAMWAPQMWNLNNVLIRRSGPNWMHANAATRMVYPCKDGYVLAHLWGGADKALHTSSEAIVSWMEEEGAAPEWLTKFDWVNEFSADKWTQDLVDRVQEPVARFFLTKTKNELYEGAVKRRVILVAVQTGKDISEDRQLAARDFWTEVEYPELNDTIRHSHLGVLGAGCRFPIRRRAPLIGEHNEEIYIGELGLTKQNLIALKQAGVI